MKVLLSTLNAKYIHSSLALRSLLSFSREYSDSISIIEFTINHHEDLILGELYDAAPDILCFSCYIWNIEMTLNIVTCLKKVLPDVCIVLGGPEVSFDGDELMGKYPEIDVIVIGEGERSFKELLRFYIDNSINLSDIYGIIFRQDNRIFKTLPQKSLNLNSIPFVYCNKDMELLKNKIIYYESQRGCPFMCQYCLSSTEGVRFLNLERVYSDLDFFLVNKVKQVKFVDRTFNCNPKRAYSIWSFLIEHDNNITNFHFEISADLLDDTALDLLRTARVSLFQFEIGVQSTNVKTLECIKRKTDFNILSNIVLKLNEMNNIHLHLDLIAGLPLEDYVSFKNSFNDVYNLEPHLLQLGFLKLLKGTGLRQDAYKYNIIYKDYPPYEVLATDDLNYADICLLKIVEDIVEKYYNSKKAFYTLKYVIRFFDSPFCFFEKFALYWKDNNYHTINHSKLGIYNILLDFCRIYISNIAIVRDFLKFDMLLNENIKSFPEAFYQDDFNLKSRLKKFYQNKGILKYLPNYQELSTTQINRVCNISVFGFDIESWVKFPGNPIIMTETAILFDYNSKDELLRHASFYKIQL